MEKESNERLLDDSDLKREEGTCPACNSYNWAKYPSLTQLENDWAFARMKCLGCDTEFYADYALINTEVIIDD